MTGFLLHHSSNNAISVICVDLLRCDEPRFGIFVSLGGRPVLGNETSISTKLVSKREHDGILNFLVDDDTDPGGDETQWTITNKRWDSLNPLTVGTWVSVKILWCILVFQGLFLIIFCQSLQVHVNHPQLSSFFFLVLSVSTH